MKKANSGDRETPSPESIEITSVLAFQEPVPERAHQPVSQEPVQVQVQWPVPVPPVLVSQQACSQP
jgi:hypothetical protein